MGPRQSDDARFLALKQELSSDFEDRMNKRLDRDLGEIRTGIRELKEGVTKLDNELHRNGGSVFSRLDGLEKGQIRIGELSTEIKKVASDLSEVRGVKGQVEAVADSLTQFRNECYQSAQDRDRQLGEMRTDQGKMWTEFQPFISAKRAVVRKVWAGVTMLFMCGAGLMTGRTIWPIHVPATDTAPTLTKQTLLDPEFVRDFAAKLAAQESADNESEAAKVSVPQGPNVRPAPRRAKESAPKRPGPLGWDRNRLADTPLPTGYYNERSNP